MPSNAEKLKTPLRVSLQAPQVPVYTWALHLAERAAPRLPQVTSLMYLVLLPVQKYQAKNILCLRSGLKK